MDTPPQDVIPAPETSGENIMKEAVMAAIEKFLIETFRRTPFTYEEAEKAFQLKTDWLLTPKPDDLRTTIEWFRGHGLIEYDEATKKYRERV